MDLLTALEAYQYRDPHVPVEEEVWGIGFTGLSLSKDNAIDLDLIISEVTVFQDLYRDIQNYIENNAGETGLAIEDEVLDQVMLRYTPNQEYEIFIEVNRDGDISTERSIIVDRVTMLDVLEYLREHNIPLYDVLGNPV